MGGGEKPENNEEERYQERSPQLGIFPWLRQKKLKA